MARRRTNKSGLDEYRRKRDFARTREPAGGELAASETGRLFVVQKHAARQLHYDFRLELDGTLKSWAVPKGPSLDPQQRPLAVLVEDHPLEYGSFEGIIPEGEYGGGTVMLWDRGRWEPIGDPREGLARGDLKFRLFGEKLTGAWVLARMGGKAGEDGRNWLLIKKKDEQARPVASFNVLAERPFSALSGRSMEQIAEDPDAVWADGRAQPAGKGPAKRATGRSSGRSSIDPSPLPGARRARLPRTLKPQLATRVPDAPDGDEWLHEIKLDGYRMLCRLAGGEVRLLTRNGHDWTDRMPGIARALGELPVDEAFLDGEVVILDARGVSDFQALQNAFKGRGGSAAIVYYVFDAPLAGGFDLRRVPLIERKGYLAALLEAGPAAGPSVRYCDHIVGRGPVVFEEARRSNLEGIVSKRVDAPYESRRTDTWRKVKAVHHRPFVIGGYTLPAGSRSGLGALLVGAHDPAGRLVYCGRVGTGFSEQALRELAALLEERRRDDPPFVNPQADPDPRAARWVEPDLVADVEFAAWTADGLVRHASYQGLNADIGPGDVGREGPDPQRPRPAPRAGKVVKAPSSPDDALVAGVRISHPGRTVYPEDGVSKLDVAKYYEAVAGRMLPFVAGRPLSLVRCPLGLAGEAFYQRELGEGFPEQLRGITVPRGRGGSEDHAIVIDDLEGLIALAQMGVLEIHRWGCRADRLDRPDHLVFDLDPGPGIEWAHIVAGAEVVRDVLAGLGLESFVKTSGGKGLHVVVPITRRTPWPQAKAFAKAVADHLVRMAPLNFVATMAKDQRKLRIFVDYLRNELGATAVAPYSTRAQAGATVSTPLSWPELSAGVRPRDLTVGTVPQRLAAPDPWADFHESRQSITAAMQKAIS